MSVYERFDNKNKLGSDKLGSDLGIEISMELETTGIIPGGYPNPPRHDKREEPNRGRHNDHRHDDHRHNDHKHNDHMQDNHRPGGPPPGLVPKYSKPSGLLRVDHGSIMGCLYSYTYVWLRNGRSFWFFPTYVGHRSVSGYRWSNFGWSYTGLDLDLIDFFTCSRY